MSKTKQQLGIKGFQSFVRKNGGYILSDGTLNLQHLLPKAHDFLVDWNIKSKKLKTDIIECFKYPLDVGYRYPIFEVMKDEGWTRLFDMQYYGKIKVAEFKQDEANYIWNEDIFNFFNEISPNGYSFGGSDGDGACIGWFKVEENF